MRTLTLINHALGDIKVSEEDLSSFTDEQLEARGITNKELRRLFARAWKLADRTLSEIVESDKPEVIPVAYRNRMGKWGIFLTTEEETA
jgi:hypothetical protein